MSAPAAQITEETLEAISKAQTTGIQEGTGIYSYDLSELVSLIPVVTPFRDLVAREKSTDGNPYAVWRAIMNVNNAQPDPSMGWDYAANEVIISEQDFQAKYQPTGLAGLVTQDAYDLATGYSDPYAVMTFNTLNQVLIGDDRKQMCAQSFALARPSAPTLSTATTGGSMPATTTVYVGVAARTGSGYYYGSGNSQGNSASIATGAGSTNTVTGTVPAVRGAVCYDWFQSANGTTWYYYTTTTVNTVTMTRTISSDQALPSAIVCPDMTTMWQGTAGVPTYNASADNGSANTKDYDGFLASLAGDYSATGQWVTAGSGTTNPSVFHSLDGAALTLSGGSIAEIENYLFLPLWNSVKCSPTAIMVNAAQAQEMANLILSQPSAVTYLNTDENGRVNVTGGGRIGALVNAPAGGVAVPIEVHVSLPPGTIVARTDRVPFPQADITNVLAQRCLRDTAQFDYGISRIANQAGGGPRKEFEIRSVSAFVNRAPVAMGVLSNVA
jgi:hypothetical protein